MTSPQKIPIKQFQATNSRSISPFPRDSTNDENINQLRFQATENSDKEGTTTSEEEIVEIGRNRSQQRRICFKENCNELRRQVQLAKETQILKIEEKTDKFMNEINEFEKKSLEQAVKLDKEKCLTKLNEMKKENEKWSKQLDKYKFSNELLDQARDSLSKITVGRDSISSLLHNKMMKFKEFEDQNFILGELTEVSLDSFSEISLKERFVKLRYGFINEIKSGKILRNGDLLLCGVISDQIKKDNEAVLLVIDLKNKSFKIY